MAHDINKGYGRNDKASILYKTRVLSNGIKRKLRSYNHALDNYIRGTVITTAALATLIAAYNFWPYFRRCADYASDVAKFSFSKGAICTMKKGETIDGKLFEEGIPKSKIPAARTALTLRNYFESLGDYFDPDKIDEGKNVVGLDINRDRKFGK